MEQDCLRRWHWRQTEICGANHRDEAKRSRDDHFSRGIIGNLYEVLKAPDIGSGRLRGVRKSPESWRLSYSSIAQSVEHAAVNRAVVGSSPTRGAK